MLPFGTSVLKSVALTQEGVIGSVKNFQVQNGTVYVASERVLLFVSNFSPLENGLYEFGSDSKATGDFPLDLDSEKIKECKDHIKLPLEIVKNMAHVVAGWYKVKPETEPYIIIDMAPSKVDPGNWVIEIYCEGRENIMADMTWKFTVAMPQSQELRLSVPVTDFLHLTAAIVKIPTGDIPVFVNLLYTPVKKPASVNYNPVFMKCEYSGHTICSALNVVKERKQDEELPFEEANQDGAGSLDRAVRSNKAVSGKARAKR